MRLSLIVSSLVVVAALGGHGGNAGNAGTVGDARQTKSPAEPRAAGTRLEHVTWQVAEQQLKADAVVVLPLGAGASQHGPHLPLGTDQRLAEHVAGRIVQEVDVVLAPALAYHHVPGFTEYPGS